MASDIINPSGFGKDQTWAMVNDREWAFIESNQDEPIAERILAAAYRRVNWWGHAPFHKGQLKRGLGVRGVNTVGSAIKALIKRQRIAPESTTRCIVLSTGAVHRQYHSTDKSSRILCQCPEHVKKNLRELEWLRESGWEPYPGYYDKLYAEDQGGDYAPLGLRTGGIALGGPQLWVTEAGSQPGRRRPEVIAITVHNEINVSENSGPVTINANMPVIAEAAPAVLAACEWRQEDGTFCGALSATTLCPEHRARLAEDVRLARQRYAATAIPLAQPEAEPEPVARPARITASRPARLASRGRSSGGESYTGWDGQEHES